MRGWLSGRFRVGVWLFRGRYFAGPRLVMGGGWGRHSTIDFLCN